MKEGGCLSKIDKITDNFFCLIEINKDNSKLSIHAKFQFDIGPTSGSMNVEFLNGDFYVKFQNFVSQKVLVRLS